MSLFDIPVTTGDLTTLQNGIQFFTDTDQANSEVASINAPGSIDSVFIYATKLLASNVGLSQVAMAGTALMEGLVGIGDTKTPNTLTFLATQFLPAQLALGVRLSTQTGIPAPVFAAEALGLALSSSSIP